MRFVARIGLGLCGLALVVAPAVKAQGPANPYQPGQPQPTAYPAGQPAMYPAGQPAMYPAGQPQPAAAPAPAHNHKGLLGHRHCIECQRAYAKAHDGVDVPPPPSTMPPGAVPPGVVVHEHGNAGCAACQAGEVVVGPVTYIDQGAPGHAVAGGQVMMANAPGHAVVGGPMPGMPGMDPTPIGMARATQAQGPWAGPNMAMAGPRGSSPYDPAVRPTSIPAQTALDNSSTGRPRVISHLFGVGGITRHAREARADRQKQQHASIAYDPPSQPVTELPASMVYGQGGR